MGIRQRAAMVHCTTLAGYHLAAIDPRPCPP